MSINEPEELAGMRAAGRVVQLMLEAMKAEVRPGITTAELDEVGAGVMRQHGAQSAPALVYGFPGVSCISLNEEAVHGIPGERALESGDLVKLDVTIEKDGFMADAALTVPVGEVTEERRKLVACAERAFAKAMLVARAGFRVWEIVEPIIAAGSGRTFVAADKWTIVTADRRASAHYEHTLVITKGAPMLLTAA